VLNELVAHDPEPDEAEAALMQIVEELGPPTGPTRTMAALVLDEYCMSLAVPGWWSI